MGISDRFSLKQQAKSHLENASYNPKMIVLIHTAVMSAVLLLILVLTYLIEDGISGTGGLSGIGMRSILSTAGSVLQNMSNLLIPFWGFGYLIAMLRIVRGDQVGPMTLLDGFRMVFPILRLIVLRSLIFIGIGFVCLYPSAIIFSLTPLSQGLNEILEPMMHLTTEAEISALLDDATLSAMGNAMIPMIVIYLLMYFLICIPLHYKMKLADYALIDNPGAGARRAIRTSFKLTKGNCMALFRLDLSFWWYFVAQALLVALCYGDVLLSWLGIPLPVNATFAYFLFYVLYLLAQLVLYYFLRNQVEGTYATAYETLRQDSFRKDSEQTTFLPEN